MDLTKDFNLFAHSQGVSSLALEDYKRVMPQNYINPMIIEERKLNVASMDVFSRLMYDRIIFLGSEVNSDVANIINSQLLYMSSIGNDPIKLYINSPGGSVTDGLAIYDMMNYITPDVETTCVGLAASMGAILLSSGTKGKRSSLKHGDILIHQPLGGGHGQCSDVQIAARQMQKCKDTLYEILVENTGKPLDEIIRDADRDYWLTADEAVEYGLIDKVISKK